MVLSGDEKSARMPPGPRDRGAARNPSGAESRTKLAQSSSRSTGGGTASPSPITGALRSGRGEMR